MPHVPTGGVASCSVGQTDEFVFAPMMVHGASTVVGAPSAMRWGWRSKTHGVQRPVSVPMSSIKVPYYGRISHETTLQTTFSDKG